MQRIILKKKIKLFSKELHSMDNFVLLIKHRQPFYMWTRERKKKSLAKKRKLLGIVSDHFRSAGRGYTINNNKKKDCAGSSEREYHYVVRHSPLCAALYETFK